MRCARPLFRRASPHVGTARADDLTEKGRRPIVDLIALGLSLLGSLSAQTPGVSDDGVRVRLIDESERPIAGGTIEICPLMGPAAGSVRTNADGWANVRRTPALSPFGLSLYAWSRHRVVTESHILDDEEREVTLRLVPASEIYVTIDGPESRGHMSFSLRFSPRAYTPSHLLEYARLPRPAIYGVTAQEWLFPVKPGYTRTCLVHPRELGVRDELTEVAFRVLPVDDTDAAERALLWIVSADPSLRPKASVRATIAGRPWTGRTDEHGRVPIPTEGLHHRFEITAPGHAPRTVTAASPGPWKVVLIPEQIPVTFMSEDPHLRTIFHIRCTERVTANRPRQTNHRGVARLPREWIGHEIRVRGPGHTDRVLTLEPDLRAVLIPARY